VLISGCLNSSKDEILLSDLLKADLEETPYAVAIFDLDYTLLKGDSGALWGQFLFEKGFVGKEFLARIKDYYQNYERGD
jgi:hypothetical protein